MCGSNGINKFKNNPKVILLAKKVKLQSDKYKIQLKECKKTSHASLGPAKGAEMENNSTKHCIHTFTLLRWVLFVMQMIQYKFTSC